MITKHLSPCPLLLFEIQLLDQIGITSRVIFFEIIEMILSTSYHTEKTTSGVIVFAMFAQMTSKLFYLFGQKSDLNFRRATIFVMNSGFFDYFDLLSGC